MATPKTIQFESYTITKEDSGKIIIINNSEICDNTMGTLRDIAQKCGFDIDPKWNTQQAGAKLIAFLAENGESAASAQASTATTPVEKPTEKPAEKPVEKPAEKPVESAPQVQASKADIAGARVRVYGKAQNRTALGIMHAYMVMYPQAKLEDLEKAFPVALNPDSGVKKNFVYAEDKGTTADWNGFFKKEDELLTTGDGKKVAVVSMWTKPSFERLVAWARQYGIVVADFEAAKGGGEKGSFRLEYLNGYVPPKQSKKSPLLWIILALIAVAGIVAAILLGGKKDVKVVEKIVTVVDTVYVQQLEEIEKNYNAANFEQGKSELTDEAKFVLYDLVKVMEKNPALKLRIEGHTSAEGEAAFNQKLSEARAKAAVDFVISRGIDPARLEYAGKGSSELKNEGNPLSPENRRTEFIVIE